VAVNDDFNQRTAVRAVFESRRRPSEKLVLLALVDHWSKKYPNPRPGVSRLMNWTSQARQTVIDAIARLVSDGVLPDPNPGRGKAHVFDLTQLVLNLDQSPKTKLVCDSDQSAEPEPVPILDQSDNATGAATGLDRSADRSRSVISTGLDQFTNQHQNGSRSSEEIREEITEEITCPAPDGAGGDSDSGKASQTSKPKRRSPRGQKSPREKAPRKPKAQADTDPRVQQLWKHHHEEHLRIREVPPAYSDTQRGAAGKAFKSILEALKELEPSKAAITRALQAGYHVQPWAILKALNNYTSGAGPNGRRKHVVQTGNVDEITARATKAGEELCGS